MEIGSAKQQLSHPGLFAHSLRASSSDKTESATCSRKGDVEEKSGTTTHPHHSKKNASHVTKHNYRDRSRDPYTGGNILETLMEKLKRGKGGVNVCFPIKLYDMLYGVEKEGLSDIVSFQPHGRCFVIHKQKEFVKRILPNYFKVRLSWYCILKRKHGALPAALF